MKACKYKDNWSMGMWRNFYDLLVFRRASLDTVEFNSTTAYGLEPKLIDLLELSSNDYIIVNNNEEVTAASKGVLNIGLIKNNRITSETIRKHIRNARRKAEPIEDEVAIPKGSITSGFHERRVRVNQIGQDGTVAVLIFDDSEARRLDAVRRDFVANISHELKTPIGGISILAEAISEGSDDPILVKNFAERMHIETNRLSNLVQEIIDLSRIQDQNTTQNSEKISLKKLIEEAIYQSKIRAEKRHVEIIFACDEDIDYVADRKQLLMAISNLIENAINYSPERTTVSVVLRKIDEVAEIVISDQGVGIAEVELDRIFERFYRIDSARSRETGGTGLGLSIVKHVISNHGGDIQVWSVPGTGSTFTVLLPLTQIKDES